MVAQPVTQPKPHLTVVLEGEQRVVMRNVSWELFERILADDEERNVPRLAYNDGALELMTPSKPHEYINRVLAGVIVGVAVARGLDVIQTGSMTMTRPERRKGLEPDSSFFIQHAAAARRDFEAVFPEGFPPDLVIEVEISRSLVRRLPILSALGIPEVWRATEATVTMLALTEDGHYEAINSSIALPGLTSAIVMEFMALHEQLMLPEWSETIRQWATAAQG